MHLTAFVSSSARLKRSRKEGLLVAVMANLWQNEEALEAALFPP